MANNDVTLTVGTDTASRGLMFVSRVLQAISGPTPNTVVTANVVVAPEAGQQVRRRRLMRATGVIRVLLCEWWLWSECHR